MAYTQNPYLPKVRQTAAHLVIYHHPTQAEVGRRFGVGDSTIAKWVKRAREVGYHPIPTRSSRPKHHPRQLSEEKINAIVRKRLEHNRCAEVVHRELANDGIIVSLSYVKRTLPEKSRLNLDPNYQRSAPRVERCSNLLFI